MHAWEYEEEECAGDDLPLPRKTICSMREVRVASSTRRAGSNHGPMAAVLWYEPTVPPRPKPKGVKTSAGASQGVTVTGLAEAMTKWSDNIDSLEEERRVGDYK